MLSKPLLPRSQQPPTQWRSSLLLSIQQVVPRAHGGAPHPAKLQPEPSKRRARHPHPRSCLSLLRPQHPFISLRGHGSGGLHVEGGESS